jgi:osmoprotectant transport system ATP-binding protein
MECDKSAPPHRLRFAGSRTFSAFFGGGKRRARAEFGKLGRGAKARKNEEMLELVGLNPQKFADRFPHELSGGQRQRVGVARALAANPDLLLLDEPFGALDAITRVKLQKEFAALVKNLGKTAVFVTHDLHEAFVLGTRICLWTKAEIVLNDVPENFRQSDLPLARAYLETISTEGNLATMGHR